MRIYLRNANLMKHFPNELIERAEKLKLTDERAHVFRSDSGGYIVSLKTDKDSCEIKVATLNYKNNRCERYENQVRVIDIDVVGDRGNIHGLKKYVPECNVSLEDCKKETPKAIKEMHRFFNKLEGCKTNKRVKHKVTEDVMAKSAFGQSSATARRLRKP